MLHSLSIRDFIIVKQLDLEFNAGYTVLTGETGAGKSMLYPWLWVRAARAAFAELAVKKLKSVPFFPYKTTWMRSNGCKLPS